MTTVSPLLTCTPPSLGGVSVSSPTCHEASDELLTAIRQQPRWFRDALCLEPHEGVNFFPERGESNEPAKAICNACMVTGECLQYAIDNDISHGIFGGMSARARARMRGTS